MAATSLSLMCFFCGCAAKIQRPSGSVWVLGLARIGTNVRQLHSGCAVSNQFQDAPLEFGLEPFGLSAGLGINTSAESFVVPEDIANTHLLVKRYGIHFGPRSFPWNFGLAHFTTPRKQAALSIRASTVRGMRFQFVNRDTFLRLGYARTTILEGASDASLVNIQADFSESIPNLMITDPIMADSYE